MKIFVTGVTGGVGKIAAKKLSDMGAKVIGFSRSEADIPGVSAFRAGDVTDYAALKNAMADCDGVLHLAACHMPYDAPEHDVFRVNVGGTFNIFKACAEAGIKQLTVASSPNAIGYNFGVALKDIAYLPVDGAHPSYTTDPYSFTKQQAEEVGRYFFRRYGISSAFLRLGLDFRTCIEDWMKGPRAAQARSLRKRVDTLLALPEGEAAREVRRIENELDAARRRAFTEMPPFKNGTEYVYEAFTDEQKTWCYLVHNFLMYLDTRDLADGSYRALNAAVDGSHDIFIADHKNMLGVESAKLAAILYPGAKVHYDRLPGCGALVDCREAERLIGFRARHSFEDHYRELYG
jgi:nucleoside-diphosphate-sugar epimerase